MGVRAVCDAGDCEEDILEDNGFQLNEGEVIIDHGGMILEQSEYHGIFCSIDCLLDYLRGENRE